MQPMEGEDNLGTASLEQAQYWQRIYREILTMEECVLERIHELMASQSEQVRREVELSNVPVVVAQADRFRVRLQFWDDRRRELESP
jgi:ribosomal protein L20A (L18A)